MKQYLNVPFEEKDQAKAAGARWDASVKQWFFYTSGSNGATLEDRVLYERWLQGVSIARPDVLDIAPTRWCKPWDPARGK
jgi:hypothetical protein